MRKVGNKWYNLAEDTEVKVEWDTTINTTIENELKKGQVKIIKVDEENHEIKLENVEFQVLDKEGKVLETVKTNSYGEAMTSKYSVRDYEKIYLKEIITNEKYVLSDELIEVKLIANDISEINITNKVKTGKIRVIKVDKDNNKIVIPNVTFEVIDNNTNKVVDIIKTNEKGIATTKDLKVTSTYSLKEISNDDVRYKLNTDIIETNVEYNKTKDITVANEKKKGQIKIIKVDKDNNEVKLEGIKFEVLDSKMNVIEELITDTNGEAISSKLPCVDEIYFIREKQTLTNYVLNEEITKIVLEEEQIKNIHFENEKIKGYVEITKMSADDNKLTGETKGTLLKDAVFEIYTDKDELVDTITILENGKGTSKLIEYGNYYIIEKDSGSYNYLLNTKKYDIEIRQNMETISITIENTSVDIGLDIDKNGIVQAQPNDEIKYSFNSLKNTSNVALNDFVWTDNLPYQYIKITKLFTGTYNEDLDYVVKYKTNKTEDYIEFGKYNTQKNNYIDFTKLNLTENEYITDYKLEFGTVMPGFEAIEKPFIFAKVLPTVNAEDKWTNRTKLTGNYEEYELEDEAEWTTISYVKELKVKKLPRTGF